MITLFLFGHGVEALRSYCHLETTQEAQHCGNLSSLVCSGISSPWNDIKVLTKKEASIYYITYILITQQLTTLAFRKLI